MPKFHSHYENLKVARDASPDEIRSAYRALTRKHHPDRNPGNADSQRVMAVINVAYDTLSDPARRREHDAWIALTEAETTRTPRARPTLHRPQARYQQNPQNTAPLADEIAARRARAALLAKRVRRIVAHLSRYGVAYAAGTIGLVWFAIAFAPASIPDNWRAVAAVSSPQTLQGPPGYQRAASAPNGSRWPAGSAYVAGYEQLNQGGLSEVVIDNSLNDTDVFAKLVSLDGPTAFPVRTVFIAARSRFTLLQLSIGTYDLRYRNLASGTLFRTPAFILEEVHTVRGTQHSAATLRLYPSTDGHLQTYALGEAEFF